MTTATRRVIAALLRDMGESSYDDLRGRSDTRLASDLMEMVAAGEVVMRIRDGGLPRLFSLPVMQQPEKAIDAAPIPKGMAIYHSSPDKPYWLEEAEMVEARFGQDELFMEAALPGDFRWGMVHAFRLRADHPVYAGRVPGVYVDHDRWGLISMEEALGKA